MKRFYYNYIYTSSVQHILTKFFLAKNQKIKHLQFQIRIPHGIRRSPHPFSSQSDTSFARYGPLSVEVWGKLTFGDGSTIIAKFYSFEKPLQSAPQGAPDNLCTENSYPVYCQWLHGYIDQKTKKFVRRGRNACLEELKEKYGVKISGSTLDRIVRMGKEAKGNQVCFVRKKYDATKFSYLTAEVKEDYFELITEFSHTWRRLLGLQCPPEGIQEIGSFHQY